ncbi:NAD(P)/FAD-dependent oxidoreductase [Neobacillus niacini]|uniref:flavin-containing monooxygenase n=1 Tax=Neobacillus niacini TaxID=86668 RepID=UPI0021CB14C5|nr:NAD(P)/FAD-dependent oxidoreductase [Neobacillus niacini]MCM3766222.1 NAD(P)/FAD-dependent oxidoreductase [Neobacillus niacini]
MNETHVKLSNFDAVVVGAGFAGMYMLHRLREAGFSTRVFESGAGVGGVWYWNRYPGARCDVESIYYNYMFSEELYKGWTWTHKYPDQTEILNYLNYVADTLDLRRDIQFETKITSAHYDEANKQWNIKTDKGNSLTAKYFITGVGCISASHIPKFTGLDSFKGEWYHTAHWPHKDVNFKNKKVGIIGTGSSGIQAIPVIAKKAAHLTVFQRTPQYSLPARNQPLDPEYVQNIKERFQEIRKDARASRNGYSLNATTLSTQEVTHEEREKKYEELWQMGGVGVVQLAFNNILTNEAANETCANFVKKKIQEIVKDPVIAEKLSPTYPIAAKRIVLDTDYYETYNRDNVTLVDVKKAPIIEVTPKGLRTTDEEYDLDILIFATGFDGMTGPLLRMDIRGKDGVSLKEKWENGSQTRTYLGIANAGFPNFFMITGPESPSVLGNVPVAIEQHVDWIANCLEYLKANRIETIEASKEAEEKWSRHCQEVAQNTLYVKTDSWYTGANIEGKPKRFPIYAGGYGTYREICDEIAIKNYEGFIFVGVPLEQN